MSSNFQSRLIPVEGEGSSESSFKSRLVPAEDQGFFEKRGRDLLEAGKKQIGYGVQAASAIAGTPRRFTELLNLIPTATQKYLGFGKPATEEELSKLPTSEEAYQFLTQKLGLPEGENKEALEFYENAADLIATGTPPQIAIAMAVGGSLSKQAASAAGFGETGQLK